MRKSMCVTVVCATLVASVAAAAPAAAHSEAVPPPTVVEPKTLASGLTTPLSLEVDHDGVAYVGQYFAGLVTEVHPDGTTSTLASAPGFGIGAVSLHHDTLYYTTIAMDGTDAHLVSQVHGGPPTEIADLLAYEKTVNPDQVNTYGFVGLPQACADQFGPSAPVPARYTGAIDSNPYASLALDGVVYIADAGANAILRVDHDGTVSTVAVMPPTDPIVTTAEAVAAAGFPACSAGYSYRFESVPTDVELGPDGWLYVSSLPGGPEGPGLGARGAVYKVNPDTGEVVLVATGFGGATGLAVSQTSGTIYVAELFGGPTGSGRVSVVASGSSTPVELIVLPSPAAIELRGGKLYVTTDAFVPDATGNPQAIGKVTVVPLTGSAQSDDSHDDSDHHEGIHPM